MAYKDGFVIEYAHQGGRISCYKCEYFDKSDKTCGKMGVYVPDVAYEKWKKCKYFDLVSDWDTEEMRMKAARARALAQGKKSSKKKKSKKKAGTVKRQAVGGKPASSQSKPKNETQKPQRKKLDGISEIVGIGTKVTSPKYGKGKVVGVEGKWVTVAFVKGAKRIRFDIVTALKSGGLSL